MLRQKTLGGNGRRQHEATEFVQINGFEISFIAENHVMYRRHGAVVVASSSLRSPDNVKRVIGHLKRAMEVARPGCQPGFVPRRRRPSVAAASRRSNPPSTCPATP